MNTIKIGWLGLGNMGIPMSQQLIKAGYPVTIYNRNKEKTAGVMASGAGVAVAATPAELTGQTDLIFIMVTDDQAIRDLFTDEQGLLSTHATGKLFINMSTVSPGISKEMAALCRQHQQAYLDAPVSGSVKQAEEGQLVIMAGGEAGDFETARPLLEKLGKLVMHIGGTGAGNTAKLAMNVLLGFHAQGLAEAVVFARNHGVKTEDFITLMNNSALGNVFGKIKGQAILTNNYQAAFSLKNIAKDLRLAKDEGLTTPLAVTAYQTFQQALPAYGDEDIIAIIKQVENKA